jgi:hypothetical protein
MMVREDTGRNKNAGIHNEKLMQLYEKRPEREMPTRKIEASHFEIEGGPTKSRG